MSVPSPENKAAPGVPFYSPAQEPPAGTATDQSSCPTLFKPITTRGVSMPNRFVVSPMCQYSADDGHLTDYHLVHLGQMAMRGAGLVFVEATAVEARGRISPQDSGLWKESQVAPLKRIVEFVHSQGAKIGIQLAHAGRKASTLAPWLVVAGRSSLAGEEHGGWPDDVVGPSAIPFYEGNKPPKELTVDEIKGLVKAFADAAKRSVEIGFDTIEIHGAHGYLITSFLSPLSNVSKPTCYTQKGGISDFSFRNVPTTTVEATKTAHASSAKSLPPPEPSFPPPCPSGCASPVQSGWSGQASRLGMSKVASVLLASCLPSASTFSTSAAAATTASKRLPLPRRTRRILRGRFARPCVQRVLICSLEPWVLLQMLRRRTGWCKRVMKRRATLSSLPGSF